MFENTETHPRSNDSVLGKQFGADFKTKSAFYFTTAECVSRSERVLCSKQQFASAPARVRTKNGSCNLKTAPPHPTRTARLCTPRTATNHTGASKQQE
jgi:hypothetical protein